MTPKAAADATRIPSDRRPLPSPLSVPGAATELSSPLAQDPEAEFHAFFADNYRALARFAYLLTGDHEAADDVTADALTAAWRTWDRVRAAESPLAYVRRMVANIATSRLRRLVRERRAMTSVGSMAGGTSVGTDVPAVVDVRAALLQLPARKRACVVLRYAFDLSEEETAKTLGISVGTVKSQTSKAVSELERILAVDGGRAAGLASGRKARQRSTPSQATSSTGPAFHRLLEADGPSGTGRSRRASSASSEVGVRRPLRGEAM